MSKRSNFKRVERDFYPTPEKAVLPLLKHLKPNTKFSEPCAGDGSLINHLKDADHWRWEASDIDPVNPNWIATLDVFDIAETKFQFVKRN